VYANEAGIETDFKIEVTITPTLFEFGGFSEAEFEREMELDPSEVPIYPILNSISISGLVLFQIEGGNLDDELDPFELMEVNYLPSGGEEKTKMTYSIKLMSR
jgi:hypothetical protein